MKRTILLLTLTSLAGVSFAEEYIQPNPLATWANGSWDKEDTTLNTLNVDGGNWTMRLSLNAKALMDTFQPSKAPEPNVEYDIAETITWKNNDKQYIASDTLGKGLFSLTGSSYQKRGLQGRKLYNNQNTTFVMGWGNDWFASRDKNGNIQDDIGVSNGMAQGLQLGFADLSHEQNKVTYQGNVTLDGDITVSLKESTREGYDMGSPILGFDVYRADTKIQNADGWTLEEAGAGAAKVDTLDAIVTGGTIQVADLVIVHSTAGKIESNVSFTTLYLTVTLTDGETLRYMAQIDDTSTTSFGAGTLLGGSAYYDIDNFTIDGITNINNELIDFIEVYNKSYSATDVDKLIPEPTTATLSLMALAALAARRRRR